MNDPTTPSAITPPAAARPDQRDTAEQQNPQVQAPVLSLPKGGGAIRGIGEKFSANPVTGTGSMVVPIATSPGRSGFGPQLTLTYDSGSGNGPYGFGWQLSTPAITRKTNQGIPRYIDELPTPATYIDILDPDVFVLSDAEDLVPVFRQDRDGTWTAAHPGYTRDGEGWVRDSVGRPIIHEDHRDGYRVRRYRPRIEGLFARIERWTNLSNPADVHWRSLSTTNILTIYGSTTESRITDAADDRRIFSWLICETRDDKGNAVIYRYRKEDALGVRFELTHERNRGDRDDPRRQVNRYLKRIYYGNTTPLLDRNTGQRPQFLTTSQIDAAGWMFEVVFDYGDHHPDTPTPQDDALKDANVQPVYPWPVRPDPFSTYRSGFEIRTMRRCKRALMFHHFPGTERDSVGTNCLVKSTDFTYTDDIDPQDDGDINPRYSFLRHITHTGYRRNTGDGGYHKASLPPLELAYSQPVVGQRVEDVPPDQTAHLPIGLDTNGYTWTDLHGEGIPGILTEQAGAWFYQRNLTPAPPSNGHNGTPVFGPLETVAVKPNTTLASGAAFMDLAGDGLPDLVMFDGPTPGLFEHDQAEGWKPFRPFAFRLNRDTRDPNLRFLDLVGDGRNDALISEPDGFVWHESLAEAGFAPAQRTPRALDEEHGPRMVFADANQSIFLADLSGDGLADIVRIRDGEVCYWPNLGYGRFGAKITMDHAPRFDHSRAFDTPERFDPKRIRLADIDGSGTTDIIYLHSDGVRLYFNQSGNSWSQPRILDVFPLVDELATVTTVDLLGNGTACLVWSSRSPADAARPMRYLNLMADGKPHLLTKAINNLGAETHIHYAPSTTFYLQDKRNGTPWTTRLPFPVHVVERVETIDHISRNRFTTRYAYHHGYFDGNEREFRGFGMIEQRDTEEFTTLAGEPTTEYAANHAAHSHVPPVRTKTWFHTGAPGFDDDIRRRDYWRESGLTDDQARAMLLPDTVLPPGLAPTEEREAARALKGSMLRREVYADDAGPDATPDQAERARRPYVVTEQNFTVRTLQRRDSNRHGVFFTHPRESITYHYERSVDDPRVQHVLTLDVDEYGNVLKETAIGYGRRRSDSALPTDHDRNKQRLVHITATENTVTNPIGGPSTYRSPMPADTRTYEVRKPRQEMSPAGPTVLYRFDAVRAIIAQAGSGSFDVDYDDLEFVRAQTDPAQADKYFRRLIEHSRTLYRSDNLDRLLPLGTMQSLALPGETYQLAFTPGLLTKAFKRPRPGQQPEDLLPRPNDVLGSKAGDGGGYLLSNTAKSDGRFPTTDPSDYWWIPSGQVFYWPNPLEQPAAELAQARAHFFLPRRFENPFGHNSFVTYDTNDLLIAETRDALDNRTEAEVNDYRVLQPRIVSDPNGNRTEAAFDTLGMVVGAAVMGKKTGPTQGDSLAGFVVDLTAAQLLAFSTQPRQAAGNVSQATSIVHQLLGSATTRFVYDLHRFRRTRHDNPTDRTKWEPTFAATVGRETHVSDLAAGHTSKLQINLSYSDGFGREIQRKIQAEPGPIANNGVVVNPRWVGTGWTIYNNKGKPVRQYEPFFSPTHTFEFGAAAGVSPITFYDPTDRLVATLYPNHTYDKVVFDPWQQTTYDANDTSAPRNDQTGDPRTDPDIRGYVASYFAHLAATNPPQPWQTWYAQRASGGLGPDEQAAATRAAAHADTPATVFFDALGRTFLTESRNRVVCPGHELDNTSNSVYSRIDLDIEGNQRTIRDTVVQAGVLLDRIVMRYDYNLVGTRTHQANMEAGTRWILNDVTGNPIRSWDGRGHNFTTAYDELRRSLTTTVRGTMDDSDPRTRNLDIQVEKLEYGEPPPTASAADKQRAIDLNLRTRLYRHRDPAGILTNAALDTNDKPTEAYDFKGNLLRNTRQLTTDYTALPNWQDSPQLENETFEARTRYDALNRPTQTVAPHSSRPHAKRNVTQPTYSDANLLERVDVWLELDTEPNQIINPSTQPPSPVGITNIDYDAKGQRQHIDYKNGASTHYRYDPNTFRLIHLYTRRGAGFTTDCGNSQPPPSPTVAAPPIPPPGLPCGVQNLHYTYDPVGNITHTRDDAQQTLFFRNKLIEPRNDYTYDALYRLIQATGREHLGKTNGQRRPPTPPDPFNTFHTRLTHPGDETAMGTYTERFTYDAAGNLKKTQHVGADPQSPGWTSTYEHNEPSLLESSTKTNNRLSQARTQGQVAPHRYDPHGNTTYVQHLSMGDQSPNLHWDYANRLRHAARNNGAFYVYDAAGQRVRKVWRKSEGLTEERIYFDGIEILRTYPGPITENPALERETLHVMDDESRTALVETRTVGASNVDPAPRQLIRYQHANHIGSTAVELDAQAKIISYEEYAPYGSSTYQAMATETPKRYRYTGKERDEESGLNYHGVRYYAPWLARWVSPDPLGLVDGFNLYAYAQGNPCIFVDPSGTQSETKSPKDMTLDEYRAVNARRRNPLPDSAVVRQYQLDHLPKAISPKSSPGPIGLGEPQHREQSGPTDPVPGKNVNGSGIKTSGGAIGEVGGTGPAGSQGPAKTELDYLVLLAKALDLDPDFPNDEDGIRSGGIPDGYFDWREPSRIGQALYVAVQSVSTLLSSVSVVKSTLGELIASSVIGSALSTTFNALKDEYLRSTIDERTASNDPNFVGPTNYRPLPPGVEPYQLPLFPLEAYDRPRHYGTPKFPGTPPGMEFEHDPPVSVHWLSGEGPGELPGFRQTSQERKAFAKNPPGGRYETKAYQRRQGGTLAGVMRSFNRLFGLKKK
ncbi:SpvB/TcaC N-terminal domain-containing protein [Mycolicibacterium senegalense]|uniref:SpvB/TcaC N-terminal domain-containing protein n=1 Tax=Mycolicibacterium senegalense TaxID=1796 RepID=UPI003AAF638C